MTSPGPFGANPRTNVAAKAAGAAPPGGWSETALRLLDLPVTVLDMRLRQRLWSSPAFDQIVDADAQSFAALMSLFPGLEAAATELHQGRSPAQVLRAASKPLEASLRIVDSSRVLVELTDRSREAEERQRHLEDREQLLFTSRMLSLGEMATTLAHEINQPVGTAANLLRGVVMRLQRQAGSNASAGADVLQALQRALDQVMFVAKVIARIREYTHLHTPTLKPVMPAQVMRACASLLDWEVERAGIVVTHALPDEPLWVQADELMLQQVLVNLMRNAIDAMRGNAADQRALVLEVKRDGPQVELVVSDNGSGISEQTEAMLFTPFASTKPTGTGIGLNICRSFVELHHGRLWFSRNSGRGISFHAALPLIPAPAPAHSKD